MKEQLGYWTGLCLVATSISLIILFVFGFLSESNILIRSLEIGMFVMMMAVGAISAYVNARGRR